MGVVTEVVHVVRSGTTATGRSTSATARATLGARHLDLVLLQRCTQEDGISALAQTLLQSEDSEIGSLMTSTQFET